MTVTPQTDELAAVRQRLAALEARTARPRRRAPQRLRALAAAGVLTALLPLGIMAANPSFSDLGSAASVHQPNIQTIANAGITTGFDDPDSNDPNVRVYYPKDNVTREEMASFLARLGGLGGNTPIVNAATAQTVANGGVTAASISPAGSTTGQVLTSTGNGVAWQNATGGGGGGAIGAAAGGGPNSIATPLTLGGTPQQLQSVTIIAPSAGYVQVSGMVAFQLPLLPAVTTATVQLQNITTDQTSPSVATNLNISLLGPQPVSETWVFPVQAGENKFAVIGSINVLGTIATQADLSALFVPGEVAP